MRYPDCYGWLYDRGSPQCQSCLVNSHCGRAMEREKARQPKYVGTIDTTSQDKRMLVLAVCRKFGLPMSFIDRSKKQHDINEENVRDYTDVAFLLSNVPALQRLLSVELKEE